MRVALSLLVLVGLAGCQLGGPRATDGGLHSENPGAKLYAIRAAGEAGHDESVPDLVELLDHDDPAVRLYTIQALERITGERRGYLPYAEAAAREQAIARWVAAVESAGDAE